ncbi:MAG: cytochrome P450 [Pseudomonadota bacterium]
MDHTDYLLPPGSDVPPETMARPGRMDIMDRFERFGPVCGFRRKGKLTVFVYGLERGTRLLEQHESDLRVVTMKLEHLFEHGFMRAMVGSTHRNHRADLSRAVVRARNEQKSELTAITVIDWLSRYQHKHFEGEPSVAFRKCLSGLATGLLLRFFFGAIDGTDFCDQLEEAYHRLGPDGLIWYPGQDEEAAFNTITDILRGQLSPQGKLHWDEHGVLGHLTADGVSISESMLGNLIYMVEMGRFDLYSLFRWISKYAVDYPEKFENVRQDRIDPENNNRPYANCFVKETLRMDQSEKLARLALNDFVFENLLIPQGAAVQVCLWESHKSPEHFDNPFDFDPDRFLVADPEPHQYSPFGLDRHRCPLEQTVTAFAADFVGALARAFDFRAVGNGEAVRGLFHWQPPPGFALIVDSKSSKHAQ